MSVAGTSLLVGRSMFVADGRTDDEKHVFVRGLEDGEFHVTPETTLGGCGVAGLGSTPHELGSRSVRSSLLY